MVWKSSVGDKCKITLIILSSRSVVKTNWPRRCKSTRTQEWCLNFAILYAVEFAPDAVCPSAHKRGNFLQSFLGSLFTAHLLRIAFWKWLKQRKKLRRCGVNIESYRRSSRKLAGSEGNFHLAELETISSVQWIIEELRWSFSENWNMLCLPTQHATHPQQDDSTD